MQLFRSEWAKCKAEKQSCFHLTKHQWINYLPNAAILQQMSTVAFICRPMNKLVSPKQLFSQRTSKVAFILLSSNEYSGLKLSPWAEDWLHNGQFCSIRLSLSIPSITDRMINQSMLSVISLCYQFMSVYVFLRPCSWNCAWDNLLIQTIIHSTCPKHRSFFCLINPSRLLSNPAVSHKWSGRWQLVTMSGDKVMWQCEVTMWCNSWRCFVVQIHSNLWPTKSKWHFWCTPRIRSE